MSTSTSPKILIIDDDDALRRSMARSLVSVGYQVVEAANGEEALACLGIEPDIAAALCDIRMPGRSGIDLLREIAVDFADIAVLMMTGVDDPNIAKVAFDIGAYGFLVKPFDANELVINLAGVLRRRDIEFAHRAQVRALEHAVTRTRTLGRALDRPVGAETDAFGDTVETLARALSLRNDETRGHLERVGRSAVLLAAAVEYHGHTADEVRLAVALHDVGKIGIPDAIFLKPGSLDAEERATMQRHAEIGYQLLVDAHSPVANTAADVARTHHEWWDGSGYPRALMGEEIPLLGRIAAIVEVFDALTSERSYRPARHPLDARRVMMERRGTQFDPRLLDAFFTLLDDVVALRSQYPDDAANDSDGIRILVVDDHEMVRDSLVQMLATRPNFHVVGTAGSVAEARAIASARQPDVVVMDFQLPDGDGVDATRQLRAMVPGVRVVMLTGRTDDEAVVRALSAGCCAFVPKTEAVTKLISTVTAAYEGEETASMADMSRLLVRLRPTHRGLGSRLSGREVEVLSMLASGLANKQIARELGLSLNTVRNHSQNILKKLDAHSRLEAVATGIREGVIAAPA